MEVDPERCESRRKKVEPLRERDLASVAGDPVYTTLPVTECHTSHQASCPVPRPAKHKAVTQQDGPTGFFEEVILRHLVADPAKCRLEDDARS